MNPDTRTVVVNLVIFAAGIEILFFWRFPYRNVKTKTSFMLRIIFYKNYFKCMINVFVRYVILNWKFADMKLKINMKDKWLLSS